MLPDAYGCVVANRFGDLLDDDADPFDLITQVEAEKEKQRKKKKEEEEKKKKTKQKRPGQRESQKDRRLPRGSDAGQDPVPGQSASGPFWHQLLFLDCSARSGWLVEALSAVGDAESVRLMGSVPERAFPRICLLNKI
uniref:Intracellular hyaluronan-binding protein 4 N-terminal domain-containing protein n=1 Tax=Salarias fasciatus TaxID=181472 RepID=A0A672JHC5_SALFA